MQVAIVLLAAVTVTPILSPDVPGSLLSTFAQRQGATRAQLTPAVDAFFGCPILSSNP